MDPNSKPIHHSYIGGLILAGVLAMLGWGGLYYLVMSVYPTSTQAKLVFLVLWGFALIGTAWPVLLAVNQRWSQHTTPARIWRQSAWITMFGVLVAWLQMNHILTLALTITLGGTIGLVEIMLILRDREQVTESNDGE